MSTQNVEDDFERGKADLERQLRELSLLIRPLEELRDSVQKMLQNVHDLIALSQGDEMPPRPGIHRDSGHDEPVNWARLCRTHGWTGGQRQRPPGGAAEKTRACTPRSPTGALTTAKTSPDCRSW